MTGDTENARQAAQEMTNSDRTELMREMVAEGAFHVVVEGGYHMQALTDEEADFLTMLLIEGGVAGLSAYANATHNDGDRRNIAMITPLISTSGSTFENVIHRLDDGNDYPGMFLDWDSENETYTLYEEGYGDE